MEEASSGVVRVGNGVHLEITSDEELTRHFGDIVSVDVKDS